MRTSQRRDAAGGCHGARKPVSLQVLPSGGRQTGPPPIRKSRNGPRRAAVLVIVQLLLLAHVLHWIVTGRTVTPVEPSESMEFVKHGVINAGLIFFALALLATLILGRWFCGWGCHVVMLQDFCGWLMKRVGIRPQPFRSRLLVYVPLILAIYMFIWPAIFRWGLVPFDGWLEQALGSAHWLVRSVRSSADLVGVPLGIDRALPPWQASLELTTSDFWGTFAGVAVAIPFLLICGFGTVYFLGAKGFCTYGCPYGGFFAPLDRLAVGSIRVTDACEHCGHCTAVCTSNVRVHEEVREYGMVVDSGCMKCLDCVSVCPNDALYFGFGRPSVHKGEPRKSAPRRVFDLTWPEEIGLAAVFAFSFFSVRSVYGLVPMLMAAGTAGCITFIAWKLRRLVSSQNVNLYRFRLKYKGHITRSGWVAVVLGGLACLVVVHCAVIRFAFAMAERSGNQANRPPELVFSPNPPPMENDSIERADRAIGLYRFVSGFNEGGIGLPFAVWQEELDLRIARLQASKLDFAQAERTLSHSLDRNGRSERFASSLAWVLRAQGKRDEALSYYGRVLREEPEYHLMLDELVQWSPTIRAVPEAIEICESRLRRDPEDLPTLRWLSLLYLEAGRMDEGIGLLQRVVEREPLSVPARQTLAAALVQQRRLEEALQTMQEAMNLRPADPQIHFQVADILDLQGRAEEAATFRSRGQQLLMDLQTGGVPALTASGAKQVGWLSDSMWDSEPFDALPVD